MKKRLDKIKSKIEIDKKVTVYELSKTFNLTEETIRRDLEKLELEGFLTRTFGGAIFNNQSQKENMSFYTRASINIEEKRKIASLFYNMIENKKTIAADSSTTVMEAIKAIKNINGLTILSSSTEIFRELLGSKINIISIGGTFNEKTLSLQGNLAKENIKRYYMDIALISCKGLDINKGVMDSNEGDAEIKMEMIKQASEVILLADNTKFNKKALVQFLDLNKVNYIITDKKPDDEWIDFCRDANINLIY